MVLDMASPFVYLGRLVEQRNDSLLLEEVDAHDLRDTTTTREKYVRDAREHGVSINRKRTWVSLRDVVAIARLQDVVVD